jgi:LemA protein
MDPNISVAVALGAFFVWALVIWSRLARLRSGVAAALTQVEAEARRLRELVPPLEQATARQLGHGNEPLAAAAAAGVAAQAAAATDADAFASSDALSLRASADDRLAAALNRLLAAAEADPALGNDASLQQLAREFTACADRLAAVRRSYNQSAADYNAALQAFPAVMFAGMLGFKPAMPME